MPITSSIKFYPGAAIIMWTKLLNSEEKNINADMKNRGMHENKEKLLANILPAFAKF